MIDLSKIKKNDILYTVDEQYDTETNVKFGIISIRVNEIVEKNGFKYIKAYGKYLYSPEALTTVKPKNYKKFGETFECA